MVARVVKDQHVLARFHIARQDVPGRTDQVVARAQHLGMGQPAGGDDHRVGVGGQHVVHLGIAVEAERHAVLFAHRHPPRDDRDHLAPPLLLGGQADLAAGLVRGLEDGHGMPAFGGYAGGLQPGRTGAHDGHAAPVGRGRDVVGHRLLAPGRGIVQAEGQPALIDAVQAIVGADAGADVILAALDDLAHQMRVGHVRPRHAHHVQKTRGDGVTRGRDVGDLGGVKGGKPRLGPDPAREFQMRRVAHALHRDQVGQPGIGVDMAAHHVQEIDQPAVLQQMRHPEPLLGTHAAGQHLIAGIAQANDEIRPAAVADRAQHLHREAQPVLQAAAPRCLKVVGQG